MGGRKLISIEDCCKRAADSLGVSPQDFQAAFDLSQDVSSKDRGTCFAKALNFQDIKKAIWARSKYRALLHILEKQNGHDIQKSSVPPMPGEFREAMILIGHIDKLKTKRNALDAQIETLNQEVQKIDQEMAQYKPVLERQKLLIQAVQQLKESQSVRK